MEGPLTGPTAVASLLIVAGLVAVAAPATADLHGACDGDTNPDAGIFNPASYANVFLTRNASDDGFTYESVVNCPGADIIVEDLSLFDASDQAVASTSAPECRAGPASPCTASGGIPSLDTGTYQVILTFDADDPNDDSPNPPGFYDDTTREQHFRWTGQGQPVVTCASAGGLPIHAGPSCPP